MYIGEFTTQLGEKNRVAIPKRLREQLEESIIVTRGYEQCLLLVDEHHWESLLGSINQNPLLQMDVRDTKRYLLGGAFELELDKQGRFVMPESLISFGELEKSVVFLGVGEWIEIWGQSQWEAKLEKLTKQAGEIADRLET